MSRVLRLIGIQTCAARPSGSLPSWIQLEHLATLLTRPHCGWRSFAEIDGAAGASG